MGPLEQERRAPARNADVAGRAWMVEVRSAVDATLVAFFADKRSAAARLAPECVELVAAVESLTLRGGKRLRPAVLHAGYCAAGGEDVARCAQAGAALEVLQSYLLIHDDWMDGDPTRRGGPSVHVALAERFASRRTGDALAVLAGDLASAWAWELLLAAPFDDAARRDALATFRAFQEEVAFGQQLDLLCAADVARMHALKTTSYTVRGPLVLGALLGGATAAQLDALRALAEPLGTAFQLRDDLLGTFGDPQITGKPVGNDLRAGKRTAVLAAAEGRLGAAAWSAIRDVLGRRDASDAAVRDVTALLDRCGARDHVEREIAALADATRRALGTAPLSPRGRARMADLVDLLSARDR